MGYYGIQIDDYFFICPSGKEELNVGTGNHSCNPNHGVDGSIKLVAIRDISVGEELTIDYAFFGTKFNSFKCTCGQKNCRGVITQEDWKLPVLQKKYYEYFSTYVKKKIAQKL